MRYLVVGLLLVIAVIVVVAGEDPVDVELPRKENFHLILLVGQSNMAGRGTIEKQDQVPHPRVLMFTKDERWVPAVAPLHFDKPDVCGVGIGRAFAMEIAEANPEITVGLIPCAVGGTEIACWEPGGYHEGTESHPYDDTIRRTKQALASGDLKAILWHQGESDAEPGKAEKYEQKLHALIARFRKALDTPNVPFLAGQMGQFVEQPWSDAKKLVDAAHRGLGEAVPYCALVRSDALSHKGDAVHFDSQSYREFGRRYAKVYLNMQ